MWKADSCIINGATSGMEIKTIFITPLLYGGTSFTAVSYKYLIASHVNERAATIATIQR
jgi:hypothetical protein